MAAHGTTTVEAKSGYGLELRQRTEIAGSHSASAAEQWPGTVVPTLLGAHVVPPEYRDNPDEYVRIVCEEMIPTVAHARTGRLRRRLLRARSLHRRSNPFASCAPPCNTASRPASTSANSRRTALELFAEFHPASVDHLDHLTDADIAWLAKSDTVATLLPAANYFLGLSTFPPARKLIDAGVAVALATDYNPGTSPTTSMPFVLSVACTHMKMSPAEAITAATINGACALDLQRRKGSLEPGKDADIAIFDATDYRELAVLVRSEPVLEDAYCTGSSPSPLTASS